MWVRDLKILQQTKKGDIFITLFELVLWNGKTRYHTTFHAKEITKQDFEDKYANYRNGISIYKGKDHNYLTKAQAENLYNMMIESNVEIKPVETLNPVES